MNLLASLRQRLDNGTLIVCFGAIYLASQAWIGRIVHPLGPEMLFVQTTLSAERVREIFAAWEAAGLLDVYASHYRYDMIHPLWYGVFLAAALAKGFNANAVPARFNGLLLLPFLAAGCDVLENRVHQAFLAERAAITPAAVLLGNGAANLKWLIAAGAVLAVGALTLRALRR